MQTTRFGRDGETAAEKYLEGKGYHFLSRNFKLPTAKVIERNGKTYTVEADVYGDGIKMGLLSQGHRIKVISPDDFVEEVKNEIELMKSQYH